MSKYEIGVTCLRCGGDVELVTANTYRADVGSDARVEPGTNTAVTVIKCQEVRCGRQWLIRVVLTEGPTNSASEVTRERRQTKRLAEI